MLGLVVAADEDRGRGFHGHGSVAESTICGAVGHKSDGERVVLFVDWQGGYGSHVLRLSLASSG